MNTARQLVLWGMPGWLFFIFLGIFFGIRVFIMADNLTIYQMFIENQDTSLLTNVLSPKILLLTGTTSIPIGFVVYQVYYFLHWRGFTFWRTQPADRGFCVVCGLALQGFMKQKFGRGIEPATPQRWKERPKKIISKELGLILNNLSFIRDGNYSRLLRQNWIVAMSLWRHIQKDHPNLTTQNTIDMYHSLGASSVGLTMAFLAYAVYESVAYLPKHHEDLGHFFIATGAILGFFIVSYFVLRATRRHMLFYLLASMRQSIIAYCTEAQFKDKKPANAPCPLCFLAFYTEQTRTRN